MNLIFENTGIALLIFAVFYLAMTNRINRKSRGLIDNAFDNALKQGEIDITIPTLNAKAAQSFNTKADASYVKKATVDFSKQVKSAQAILNKAKLIEQQEQVAKHDSIPDVSNSFLVWWQNTGSAIRPNGNDDYETHAKRVCEEFVKHCN